MVYGELKREVKIGNYVVKLEKKDDNTYCYSRTGEEANINKLVVTPEAVNIRPVHPISVPQPLTNYIYVKLQEPVNLPPNGEIWGYIKIPVDIGICINVEDDSNLIDVFPVKKVKYALYGQSDAGVIARFNISKFSTQKPDEDTVEAGEAVAQISIENGVNQWVEVGIVLIDAYMVDLWFMRNTWQAETQLVNVNVYSQNTAKINYVDKKVKGFEKVYVPSTFKARRLVPARLMSEMLWGLK